MSPNWVDESSRAHFYPNNVFLTGSASAHIKSGDNVNQVTATLKQEAQKVLSESIRMKVVGTLSTSDRSIRVDNKERVVSTIEQDVKTSTNVEIVGVKTETYFDQRTNEVYAFAYANKYEVIGYYKANIGMLLQQAEGSLSTAKQLEQSGEKSKARKQCEGAIPIFAKVRYAQDLLTALDAADSESLQQAKSETLRNQATQMMARLAQGLYVYMKSSEDLFGKKVNIIAGKLKAILAQNGCSFTDNAVQADLQLTLSTTTREISNNAGSIVFCYADTQVDVYDNHKGKSVYNDEVSQKGGGVSQERAGRKALEDAAPEIAKKIMPWIKN
ncbi:hypothetical protein FACS1894156_4370 [Bacteroidia bacterium]|nr:hypothetical protein FACS1894156_4370 [Bacteroidia bacterium]